MKTKIDKKAKKRSLSETSLSIKPNQKQKTVTASKKSPKKAKLVGLVQNGNSTMRNKVQILKKMYKQKEKPKIKQTNKGLLAEIKTEEDTKLSIAKLYEESVAKKMKTKEKKLKNLQIRQIKRELRKKKRRNQSLLNVASSTLSIEEIEARIEEIKNREVLSKRAKKMLNILNRKLKLEKSALNKSEELNTIEKKGKKKQQIGVFIKTEPVSNEDNKNKMKKEHVKHETIKIKQEKSNQNYSNIIKTENEEDEDEDQSDTETEESMHNANEQFDDESDEDEEDEDTENDEDTEDDDDEKGNIFKVKKEDGKKPLKQAKQSLEHQKNDRYVLFVGNLSSDVTADDLKQHFLTKVDTVSNVRISIKADRKTPRGIAFVEVTNRADFEKGLSLHHTIIKKRRIVVKSSINKKNVGKNFGIMKKKPQAFQKAKKFAGGNQGKQKSLKKEKQS